MKYLLGDICSFAKGASTPRARMYTEGDYLYLHYGDLYKGHELYVDVNDPQKELPFILDTEKLRNSQFCQDEDIIYVLTSETVDDLGKALLLNNPSSFPVVAGTETTIMRIERRDVALPRYINYLLQTTAFKKTLQQYVTGMKVFRVHPRDIARIEIDLPSLGTQAKAVAILDAISEKIRNNAKGNDYLCDILDILFKEEVLGAIDETWTEASLLDIANYKNGLAMQKFRPEGDDPGLPVLKIKELGQGWCAADSERCRGDIDEAVRIHDGDLVFSWSGTLLLDFWAGGDAGLNQHLFKVTSEKYDPWFYYLWTNYHMRKFIALAKDRATTMGHIKRSALAESKVFVPSDDKLNELSNLFAPLINQTISIKVESRKLSELRDALLSKLMSGEIDVSQVDVTQLNNHLYQ